MSGPQGNAPNNGFQSRLTRVADRRAPIDAGKPHVDLLPDWKANIKRPVTLVAAVFVGIFGVFLARLIRFHLTGGTLAGDNPDITLIIDAGIAVVVSFVVFRLLKIKGREFNVAQLVGVIAMIGIMQNFVHAAPGAFGLLFSKQWAEDVVTYSEPGSIYIRGKYIVVLPSDEDIADEPEERALPKVRRLG
jgi:hypothetical protein